MMRLKRKLYSNNVVVSHKSSSLRIKRFSQVKEEERLYALPFKMPAIRMPAINLRPKINTIKSGISTRFNRVGTGIQAGWIKGTNKFRDIFNIGNKRMGTQSGFKSAKVTNPQLKITGISTINNTNPISAPISPSISKQGLSELTKLNTTNPVSYTYNPKTDPKMYHIQDRIPTQREISANTSRGKAYYDSLSKELGSNNSILSRKDVVEQMNRRNGTVSPTTSSTSVQSKTYQYNPETQPKSQPKPTQEKPLEIAGLAKEQPNPSSTPTNPPTTTNTGETKTTGPKRRNIAPVNTESGKVNVETPAKQPTETGVKAPVENSNPSTTTNPTSTNIDNSKSATNTSNNQNQLVNKTGSDNKSNLELKSETTIPTTINDSSIANTQNQFGSKDSNSNNNLKPGSKTTSTNQNQPNNDDKKFRLGWKGKLALGTAAVGGALYGGGKLVSNMMKDDDEKR